jgi:hypothetical protein
LEPAVVDVTYPASFTHWLMEVVPKFALVNPVEVDIYPESLFHCDIEVVEKFFVVSPVEVEMNIVLVPAMEVPLKYITAFVVGVVVVAVPPLAIGTGELMNAKLPSAVVVAVPPYVAARGIVIPIAPVEVLNVIGAEPENSPKRVLVLKVVLMEVAPVPETAPERDMDWLPVM